jgi:alkanesulfonate monooxygenase SsuD/methylene tetrahydromethanopterin reductase-like flavin-dependent oxidoreductase (luciferase family)
MAMPQTIESVRHPYANGEVKRMLMAEFDALGVPFHERGARTTEYLRVWQACWAFSGNFVSFADMYVNPKPLQQPHPPIWVGGSSDAALRRAAAFAALWQPTPTPVADWSNARVHCAKPAIGSVVSSRRRSA